MNKYSTTHSVKILPKRFGKRPEIDFSSERYNEGWTSVKQYGVRIGIKNKGKISVYRIKFSSDAWVSPLPFVSGDAAAARTPSPLLDSRQMQHTGRGGV